MGGEGLREITVNGEEKMKTGKAVLLVTSYLLLVTITGCGYTTRSMISNDFRTIYVTPFLNKVDITNETYTSTKYRVYRPGLETDITSSVTNKFLFDGNLKPVKEESADLILKGELIDFRRDPVRYDTNDNVEEYRINLVVNISLWNRKENKLVWQENSFTGYDSYFTSGPQAKSEDVSVNNALEDLARRIVERAVEQW
jgi:hypothetical protein